MAILTDYMEQKLLNHMFGSGFFQSSAGTTRLTSLYLGISTTAFSESDTASQALAKEPGTSGTTYNGNGYQRVSVYSTSSSSGLSVANSSGPNVENKAQISFPQVTTSNWGSIGYWALYEDQVPSNGTSSSTIDADDGQKPLMIGSFSAAVTTNVGDQFRIATGDFTIELPDAIHSTGTGGTSVLDAPYHSKHGLANLLGFPFTTGDYAWDYMGGSQYYNKFWMGVSTSAFGTSGINNETDAGSQEPGYSSSYSSSSLSAYNKNGYTARPEITFNTASTSNGVTTITNSNAVEFPECASNNWGSITHFAIFAGGDSDANAETHGRYAKYPAGSAVTVGTSSGNAAYEQSRPFFIGALDSAKTINVGDTLRFPAGSISIALD